MKNFFKYFHVSRRSLGVILIEFAFSIPIFLILIYYLHDLPKMRLMQRKMQFVAYETAAILQHLAEQKAGTADPALTSSDFMSAMRIAYLSIFFGNTMNSNGGFPLGYFPHMGIIFMKGVALNNAQIIWFGRIWGGHGTGMLKNQWQPYCSPIRVSSNMNTTKIASWLTINSGEFKIFLDCCLYYDHDTSELFSDGRKTNEVSRREAFGFLFAQPLGAGVGEKSPICGKGFFRSVVAFSTSEDAIKNGL